MEIWLAVVIVLLAFVVGLVFVPIRVRITLQGRGEPSGAWALAGGAQVGPLSLTAAAALGVAPQSYVHLFGKQLWHRAVARPAEEKSERDTDASDEPGKRAGGRRARLLRWFDPLDLLLFLVRERRRIEIGRGTLKVELDYSFEDVALTGKMQGVVYVLSGMFHGRIDIVQNVSWESVDRARAALSGELRLWPGLAVVDTLNFVVRHARVRRKSDGR